jgi:hypothetical protein
VVVIYVKKGLAGGGVLGLCLGLLLGLRSCQLPVEFAPLLLRPAQLLNRCGKVKEVDGDDRGSGPQVCIPDQSIELPPGLDHPCMDLPETFPLLGGVAGPVRAQMRSYRFEGLAGPRDRSALRGDIRSDEVTPHRTLSQARERPFGPLQL